MNGELTVKKARKRPNPKRRQRIVIQATVIVLLFALLVSLGLCWSIAHPQRHPINETPAVMGLDYKDVTFPSREDHLQIKGWLLPAANSDRTVIIAHGYRNNRLQDDVPALSLAGELVNAGYHVLMFDFRNCGESDGNMTSIGQYEVRDLLGAIDFVRAHPDIAHRIALLGFSMGASTAILAGSREPAVDAVIADSPFADLNRHLGSKAYPFHDLLMPELSLLTGINPEQVSPVKAVQDFSPRPLLLIHGDADGDISVENSREILRAARAAGSKASLWVVPGADHLKSFSTAKKAYSSKVIEFLDNSLK